MKGVFGKYLLLELGVLVVVLGYFGIKNFDDSGKAENKKAVSRSFGPMQEGFVSIFDGKSLDGWEGDPEIWRVENERIVGEIKQGQSLEANSFLIYEQPMADFELKAKFKVSESGNSGIQYRSERLENLPFALRGYQADIDGKNTYTGQNYEERKRTTLAYRGQKTRITSQPDGITNLREYIERNAWKGLNLESELGDRAELGAKILQGDWNEMHLVIKGNIMQHFVNGVLMSEVQDEDLKNRSLTGFLGLQVHVGPPMKVEYGELMLKRLR